MKAFVLWHLKRHAGKETLARKAVSILPDEESHRTALESSHPSKQGEDLILTFMMIWSSLMPPFMNKNWILSNDEDDDGASKANVPMEGWLQSTYDQWNC